MRIIMTGATSGIGLEAARNLIAAGAEMIIGARRPADLPADLRDRVRALPLDLADLGSVAAFAGSAAEEADVGALVLNAGLQAVRGETSVQGLELTFAANHLAHYLLCRRLAAGLGPGARIILTASGTHDPAMKTGMPAPHHADARRLANPANDPERDQSLGTAGRRAYSTSKLCNVMTARELARRLQATRPDVAVMAYDPGFTPGTGLARHYPGVGPFIFRRILPLVVRGERASTAENSGRLLAQLATSPAYAAARGNYLAVRGREVVDIPPSRLAQDTVACEALWNDSSALLSEAGVPVDLSPPQAAAP